MSKYNGFTVEHMLWFMAQQGLQVEAKTVEVAPRELGWKITLTGDEVQVFDGTSLFMATMRAFKQFSGEAKKEREEAQEKLLEIMNISEEEKAQIKKARASRIIELRTKWARWPE